MVIVGENGTISHLNPVAEEIFSCTTKNVRGKMFSEFLAGLGLADPEILEKCDAATPYSACQKSTDESGKTRYLDLWVSFHPDTSADSRYLVFVNDVTSQKKREAKLKQAYATETTLKKVLHICRTAENLEKTLTLALHLTIARPGIKAIPRALILATENNLSQLDLKAQIGLEAEELTAFFKKQRGDLFFLDNAREKIEELCQKVSPGQSS